MKKYNKKIALILALTLSLALAIPALAEETKIQGTYQDADSKLISVLISGGTDVKAVLNPTGMSTYLIANDAETQIGELKPSGNVTTLPIVGVNLGSGDVSVKASVTSQLKGKFKFKTSNPKDNAKTTDGMIYLKAQTAGVDLGYDGKTAAVDPDKVTTNYDHFNGKAVLDALNAMSDKEDSRTTKPDKNKVVILKKGTATCKEALCTLTKATITTDASGNEVVTPNKDGYFIAHLHGYIGKGDDTKEKKTWTDEDGFTATVTWSFSTKKS